MAYTGAQLIARIRWASDTQNNTARHSDADILSAINQSIAQYRRMLANISLSNYQAVTTVTTASGTSSVSLPACEEVLAAQCSFNNTKTTLHPVGSMEQAQYVVSGRPASWMLRDSSTPGLVDMVLFPTANQAYTLTINYIPQFVPITTATTFYAEVSGGEEWVVYDVASKLALRDRNPIQASLAAERDAQERRLKALASRNREPGHRVDTRGQRRLNDLLARRYP